MRNLIYIPIIHESGDRPEQTLKLLGLIPESQDFIDGIAKNVWHKIEQGRLGLDIDYSRSRLYLEGTTSEELKNLKEISQLPKDFQRYALLNLKRVFELGGITKITRSLEFTVSLLLHGVQVEETEQENLYQETLESVNDIAEALKKTVEANPDEEITDGEIQRLKVAGKRLDASLDRRDKFMSQRINSSLKDGETGILIIGGAHNVQQYLDPDIEVRYIDPKLEKIFGEHEVRKTMESFFSELSGDKPRDETGIEDSPANTEIKG